MITESLRLIPEAPRRLFCNHGALLFPRPLLASSATIHIASSSVSYLRRSALTLGDVAHYGMCQEVAVVVEPRRLHCCAS